MTRREMAYAKQIDKLNERILELERVGNNLAAALVRVGWKSLPCVANWEALAATEEKP